MSPSSKNGFASFKKKSVWEEHVYIALLKMDNQQEPPV